ncbi:hypothetical protein J8629_21480 [Serratia fonticola]|nr:hypothetical protein [Serratia fonticola]MBP0999629.1 hypothetical protein [Serratia fonticola]MBP1004712.1 hypothetical protein [Serratia fonticola]MBP1019418.1 hypothetical protein [Serratia fonticola]
MKNKVLLENIVAKVPKSLLLIDKSDLPAFASHGQLAVTCNLPGRNND